MSRLVDHHHHSIWTQHDDSEYEWMEQDIINFIDSDSDDVYVTQLESALGRRWTVDDASRVFDRMDREIESDGAVFLCASRFLDVITDPEYEDILHRAIYQDLEYLRANGELGPDHDMEILFSDILLEIENYVNPEIENPMISSTMSLSDDDHGGLSEEAISKYLKTRSCDEGVRDYNDDDDDEEFEICVVCQDRLYQENGTIATIGCGHEYHVDCIKQWLRTKDICPLCKANALSREDDM